MYKKKEEEMRKMPMKKVDQ